MSDYNPFDWKKPAQEYSRAKRSAGLRRIWTGLTGQNNSLVPFEDLKRTLKFSTQRYRGLQPVPLDKIVGSLGRSGDFDRAFLPIQKHSRSKWISVDTAFLQGVALPAVSLYKVGDAYFVVDGHHRLSVARQNGQTFIDAEITEVQSRVPVSDSLAVEDLDVLGAYRGFLEQTRLDVLRPAQNIRLTLPGDYAKLVDHIRLHKYSVETGESRELSWEEATAHWYDHVYWPVIQAIRKNKLLADFPGHTEADLYFWLVEHAYYLSQQLGRSVDPWQVAKDYVARFGQSPQRLLARIKQRVFDLLIPDDLEPGPKAGTWRQERVEPSEAPHLFREILVAVTGAESGWRALDQAAEIAHREQSMLRGLHVVSSEDQAAFRHGRQVLEEFASRSKALGVQSSSQLVEGDIDERIIEHARWVDLVVINQRSIVGRRADRPLGTIFHAVGTRAGRPMLAVPGTQVTPLKHILLAYDASPKSREALFVFRHIITCWQATGTILTVESADTDRDMLDLACKYIEECKGPRVAARYERGPALEVILGAMAEEGADLLLMGGYGHQPLLEAFLGSTVDRLLRAASFPVLICY